MPTMDLLWLYQAITRGNLLFSVGTCNLPFFYATGG